MLGERFLLITVNFNRVIRELRDSKRRDRPKKKGCNVCFERVKKKWSKRKEVMAACHEVLAEEWAKRAGREGKKG